jgi:uncharacterized membrane protein YedE/YeeE
MAMEFAKFLYDAFGPIGGLFVFISGYLFWCLRDEWKQSREDGREMTKTIALYQSTMDRVVAVLDRRVP